jgi:hypothetical protein
MNREIAVREGLPPAVGENAIAQPVPAAGLGPEPKIYYVARSRAGRSPFAVFQVPPKRKIVWFGTGEPAAIAEANAHNLRDREQRMAAGRMGGRRHGRRGVSAREAATIVSPQLDFGQAIEKLERAWAHGFDVTFIGSQRQGFIVAVSKSVDFASKRFHIGSATGSGAVLDDAVAEALADAEKRFGWKLE